MNSISDAIVQLVKSTILPLIRKTVMEAVNEALSDHATTSAEQKEEYFKVPEAAEYLKVSVSKIQKMTASGELPTTGPTKPLYIKKSVLDAYMSRPRTASKNQVRVEIDSLLARRRK